jgi:TPP-dependent indolepyruvate ferredoxin oxidoreductase alpha subunit
MADEACAGCAQLSLLRALRRAGVEVQGGIGCDPAAAGVPFRAAPGRWGALTGVTRLLADGAPAFLEAVATAGARLVVVADRIGPVRSTSFEAALVQAGASMALLPLDDVLAVEARIRGALDEPGTVLLALAPCVRDAPTLVSLAVDPSRCNRCGACLSLGCPALSDPGDEGMAIDASVCRGCGRCAPLCRGRAIQPSG